MDVAAATEAEKAAVSYIAKPICSKILGFEKAGDIDRTVTPDSYSVTEGGTFLKAVATLGSASFFTTLYFADTSNVSVLRATTHSANSYVQALYQDALKKYGSPLLSMIRL